MTPERRHQIENLTPEERAFGEYMLYVANRPIIQRRYITAEELAELREEPKS